ncbi:kynureninase 2, partial [Polychaeton citri CBS 116435]
MDAKAAIQTLRDGSKPAFPATANQLDFAQSLDKDSNLVNLRDDFIIPTKAELHRKSLTTLPGNLEAGSVESSIYFCGNSLGLQPKAISEYLSAYLRTWGSIGVNGHFTQLEDSPLVPFQDMAEDCARKSAGIVGALPAEVVIMNTLTANLHLMMASFYKPTQKKNKILLEWRPFPSDWYAIESQIEWNGYDPKEAMVLLQPDEGTSIMPTSKILSVIDQYADELALILLPGIQYYSGQLLDIPAITEHAHSRGVTIGWDLAHAAGNVELKLHDWEVDFACWCTYKYMNAGAGAIASAFVHERHGAVKRSEDGKLQYQPRLKGWYGGDKSVRFLMDNNFVPTPGAGGFQLSNPSIVDLSCLSASLSVFNKTDVTALRSKSLLLTAYAEHLLNRILDQSSPSRQAPFQIITPLHPL